MPRRGATTPSMNDRSSISLCNSRSRAARCSADSPGNVTPIADLRHPGARPAPAGSRPPTGTEVIGTHRSVAAGRTGSGRIDSLHGGDRLGLGMSRVRALVVVAVAVATVLAG